MSPSAVSDMQGLAMKLLSCPVGLKAADADGRTRYWDKGAEGIFGFYRAGAGGKMRHGAGHLLTVHPRWHGGV